MGTLILTSLLSWTLPSVPPKRAVELGTSAGGVASAPRLAARRAARRRRLRRHHLEALQRLEAENAALRAQRGRPERGRREAREAAMGGDGSGCFEFLFHAWLMKSVAIGGGLEAMGVEV